MNSCLVGKKERRIKGAEQMKRAILAMVAIVAVTAAAATVGAHEETYKGTVVSVEAAKIQVKVIDEKTKKESTMEFGVNAKTKVLRGDKTVAFKDARVQKEERIAVTINHDVPGHTATVIRLAPLN